MRTATGPPTVVVFDAGSGATRSYWAKTQRRVATFAPTIVHDLAGLGRYPIRSAADRASTDHTTVAMACRHMSCSGKRRTRPFRRAVPPRAPCRCRAVGAIPCRSPNRRSSPTRSSASPSKSPVASALATETNRGLASPAPWGRSPQPGQCRGSSAKCVDQQHPTVTTTEHITDLHHRIDSAQQESADSYRLRRRLIRIVFTRSSPGLLGLDECDRCSDRPACREP